jgi:hypothetical protein
MLKSSQLQSLGQRRPRKGAAKGTRGRKLQLCSGCIPGPVLTPGAHRSRAEPSQTRVASFISPLRPLALARWTNYGVWSTSTYENSAPQFCGSAHTGHLQTYLHAPMYAVACSEQAALQETSPGTLRPITITVRRMPAIVLPVTPAASLHSAQVNTSYPNQPRQVRTEYVRQHAVLIVVTWGSGTNSSL